MTKLKTIIIAGGSGFLGKQLTNVCKKKYKVISVGYRTNQKYKFDLCKKNLFLKFCKKVRPDLIINCAALTNVEKCETNKALAYKTNVTVVKNIVEICRFLSCKFIHISTDQMYDSIKKFNTEDRQKIYNFYTKTKVTSEKIAKKYKKSTIYRTNFFGSINNKQGNINWIFESIKKKRKIYLINDVFFSPLYINTLVKIIYKNLFKNSYGIYNLGSSIGMSKEEFFKKIIKRISLKCEFQSVSFNELLKIYKNMCPRPKKMDMNVSKFEKTFNFKLPTLKKEITKFCNDYKN